MMLRVLVINLLVSNFIDCLPSLSYENEEYFTGLIHPDVLDRKNDPEVEEYLASLRSLEVPDSFDARDEGWIGEPKHQKSCGSCVVFTNVALIETCIARVTCKLHPESCRTFDFSEQEALECGYDGTQVNGCDGALPDSYVEWIIKKGGYMSDELNLPYRPSKLTHTCPTDILQDDEAGVKVTGELFAYDVEEELLKRLVYNNGAVQTSIAARDDSFKHYNGGIYEGCSSNSTNHGMVIVGYGEEDGEKYWILKNSWGTKWGEDGFMRVKRGVHMCGIGEMVLSVKCRHVSGSTSAPFTTTTTEASVKAECDISSVFHGYPITASGMHLSLQAQGVQYTNTVNCNQGMCAPVDMSDVTNACVALCGMDPCNEDDFKRSLGFENVSLNNMSVENFLDSIDV